MNHLINRYRFGLLKAKKKGKEKVNIGFVLSLLDKIQKLNNPPKNERDILL
jgi:hypothetical protein